MRRASRDTVPARPRAAAVAAACMAAAVQLGCASATGPVAYPAAWPPLDTTQVAEGCPDLSGSYANRAADTWPAGAAAGGATLTEVFARMARSTGIFGPAATGHAWPVPPDAESSTFRLEPEHLAVTFTGTDGSASRLGFRRYHFDLGETRFDDLFTCYAGKEAPRLRFFAEPSSHWGGVPYLYIEGGGTLVFLLKASDGSLIVQWRSDSLAVSSVIVGTRMKFDSVWWRFAPARPGTR